MKKLTSLLVIFCWLGSLAWAEEDSKNNKPISNQTISESKAKCKEEGKEGKEMVQCIKDKQNETKDK